MPSRLSDAWSRGRSIVVFVILCLLIGHYIISPIAHLFASIFSSSPQSSSPGDSDVPTPPAPLTPTELATRNLEAAKQAIEVLNSHSYDTFTPRSKGNDTGGEDENHDNDDDNVTPPRFLNMTGFRAMDNLAWDDLTRFRHRCAQWTKNALSADSLGLGGTDFGSVEDVSIWQNVSGVVQGPWVRHEGSIQRGWDSFNLNNATPWLNWQDADSSWARNITGDKGILTMRIEDKKNIVDYDDDDLHGHKLLSSIDGRIRSVRVDLTVEDTDAGGQNWDMRLHGIHWPLKGAMLLTTTSEKFNGIFGLPYLAGNLGQFETSRKLLNQTLSDRLLEKEKEIISSGIVPWSSDLENPIVTLTPSPHCEYVLYAQVHPVGRHNLHQIPGTASPLDIIQAIEAELEHPIGVRTGSIPDLQVSIVLWSPDCSFFLKSAGPPVLPASDGRHLRGVKKEVQRTRVNTSMLIYASIMVAQIQLLKYQIRESATPSTKARVSYWTLSAMVMVDGLILAFTSAWSLSADYTLLPCLTLMFASFMSMTTGGFLMAKVYETQIPQGRSRDNLNRTASPNNTEPNEIDGLPRPVTAGAESPQQALPPPIIIPSDQDIDAEIEQVTTTTQNTGGTTTTTSPPPPPFSGHTGKLIFIGLVLSFTALASTNWTPRARAIYLNSCAFLYLSMWLPQLYRNIMRNTRRALAWKFVVGESMLRLLPLAYFYLWEDNFLFARTSPKVFAGFCLWVCIQLGALSAQDMLGPRFLIPARWLPDAWDYHPVFREDSLEAGGLSVALLSSPLESPASATSGLSAWDLSDNDTDHTDTDSRSKGKGVAGSSSSASQSRRRARRNNRSGGAHTRGTDCAICTETVHVPFVRAGEDDGISGVVKVVGVLARQEYMVTPCRHIFHTVCLEGWMRYKLQCPICRDDLPPI